MGLTEVFTCLESCEAVSGSTAKMSLINNCIDDEENRLILSELFDIVYNAFRTYNYHPSTEIGGSDTVAPEDSWAQFKIVVDKLEKREATGNAAADLVNAFLVNHPPMHYKWYVRILNRWLNNGVSTSTVEKLYKGLLPQFGVQLASVFDFGSHTSGGQDWLIEHKLDGFRGLVIPRKEEVLTRNGKPLYNCEKIVNELREFDGFVFDGEFLADNWNATASIVRSSVSEVDNSTLRYHVFDLIPYDDFIIGKVTNVGQSDRRKKLEQIIGSAKLQYVTIVPQRLLEKPSHEELRRITAEYVKEGYEGSILKDPDGFYRYHRGHEWNKIKFQVEEDVEVVGASSGTGRLSNTLGSFRVRSSDGREFSVGGKLSDLERASLWKLHLQGDFVGRVVEVIYENAPKIVGRFPRFSRLRDDKSSI